MVLEVKRVVPFEEGGLVIPEIQLRAPGGLGMFSFLILHGDDTCVFTF